MVLSQMSEQLISESHSQFILSMQWIHSNTEDGTLQFRYKAKALVVNFWSFCPYAILH